jgi:hypothetical protein
MTVPTTLRWVLIALAGLAVAVAVAVLASKLTSQRIGLSSEPLGAGQSLAPPEHRPKDNDSGQRPGNNAGPPNRSTTTTAETTTTGATAPASTTTPDDSGGEVEREGSSSDD